MLSNREERQESPISELLDQLTDAWVDGYPSDKQYIPHDQIEQILTPRMIRACLGDAEEDLVGYVTRSARKILAILVLAGDHAPKHRLKDCQANDFKDSNLFVVHPRDEALSNKKNPSFLAHWKHPFLIRFCQHQYRFLAPQFTEGQYFYEFNKHYVLPFSCGDLIGRGYFGEVYRGKVCEEHARSLDWQDCTQFEVAIKTFRHASSDSQGRMDPHRAWTLEANNLCALREKKNTHLLRGIAAIQLGDHRLLLSPLADGGDLKRLWTENPSPRLDANIVIEALQQLKGLAKALTLMHEDERPGLGVSAANTVPDLIDVPTDTSIPRLRLNDDEPSPANEIIVPEEVSSHWRHGDLKPENILVFKRGNLLIGRLCISDLGLAKRHDVLTAHRRQGSSTKFASHSYAAPEAMGDNRNPWSRLFDIWSLGCIMLEFVIWLLRGYEGLEAFWSLPYEPGDTHFYSVHGKDSNRVCRVHTYAADLINTIIASDVECHVREGGSALRDLLSLVRDKVLVIELPSASRGATPERRRATASELLKELQQICQRAKSSTYTAHYVFSNKRRDTTYFNNYLQRMTKPSTAGPNLVVPLQQQPTMLLKDQDMPGPPRNNVKRLESTSRHFTDRAP